MEIEVTAEMAELAERLEQKTLANLKRKQNYSGLSASRRYYTGALGEIGFYVALTRRFIKMRFEPATDGKSDECDFTVWVKNIQVSLDIKTASQATHSFLMVPAKQLAKHPVDVYVAARIADKVIEFLGYCYIADLKGSDITDKLGLSVPTMGLEFDKLRPIEHIFQQCDLIG